MATLAPTGLPRVPNGVMFGHTEQPVAASRGQHPEPILVGRSKTVQSSPVKPRPAAISSSTSASNLLAQPTKQSTPAGSEVANGKLLARLQTAPPQSMVRSLVPHSAQPAKQTASGAGIWERAKHVHWLHMEPHDDRPVCNSTCDGLRAQCLGCGRRDRQGQWLRR